jgi:hypothetical protein
LFALAWRSAPCRKFAGICGSHKFARNRQESDARTGKSDAGNDKKQVRWRIANANPEKAQTQGERLRYCRDTVHPRRRRDALIARKPLTRYSAI